MKTKSIYTKKLGNSVARHAHSAKIKKLHVISGDSNWRVVADGSVRALRTFNTVELAVDFAKNIALKEIGEVVIHEGSGKIKNRISYSSVN